MVNHTSDLQTFDRETIGCVVRCILEQSGALCADQIARRISLNLEVIHKELDRLVDKGLAERLSPLAVENEAENTPAETKPFREYYRWIRPTDTDYLWQSNLQTK